MERLQQIKIGLKSKNQDEWCTWDDIEWLISQAEKVQRYEKALKFYADDENYEAWEEYEDATGYFNNVDFDSGDKAKNALEGLG